MMPLPRRWASLMLKTVGRFVPISASYSFMLENATRYSCYENPPVTGTRAGPRSRGYRGRFGVGTLLDLFLNSQPYYTA